jgi:hypothetical protein
VAGRSQEAFPKGKTSADRTVQGGSDKSGQLSKPHHLVKKSYILLIISLKPSQIFVEAETKTNRHFPTNINQQEATRAVIVFGLRAG